MGCSSLTRSRRSPTSAAGCDREGHSRCSRGATFRSNGWLVELRSALAAGRDLPTPPPGAQGPFSLADPNIATGRLEAAGFGDVRLSPLDEPMCFGRDADDAYSFLLTFGITRGLTHDLDEDSRRAALAAMRNLLEKHETSDGVLLDSAAWLIEAKNAGAG